MTTDTRYWAVTGRVVFESGAPDKYCAVKLGDHAVTSEAAALELAEPFMRKRLDVTFPEPYTLAELHAVRRGEASTEEG